MASPEIHTGFVYLNVDDPVVAWMVYRGELVAASTHSPWALSFLTAENMRAIADGTRSDRWAAEQALEQVRASHFANCASRLNGFFVFADEVSAAAAARWGVSKYKEEWREEVEVLAGSRVSRHDAEWITEKLAFDESEEWMHEYWSGATFGDEPIWEIVVEGTALIYGITVRELAYDVVRAVWPKSLPLLELARVAAWLESSLGCVTARLSLVGSQFHVDYVMDMRDADDPRFLRRLETYDGPRNTKDLTPSSGLVTPDLRARSFTLTANAGSSS